MEQVIRGVPRTSTFPPTTRDLSPPTDAPAAAAASVKESALTGRSSLDDSHAAPPTAVYTLPCCFSQATSPCSARSRTSRSNFTVSAS